MKNVFITYAYLSCFVFFLRQGPYFAPPYEPLPPDVQFSYKGQPMELSEKAEEAAGFFAKMLDHDYTKKDVFCKNFFEDWRKVSYGPRGRANKLGHYWPDDLYLL